MFFSNNRVSPLPNQFLIVSPFKHILLTHPCISNTINGNLSGSGHTVKSLYPAWTYVLSGPLPNVLSIGLLSPTRNLAAKASNPSTTPYLRAENNQVLSKHLRNLVSPREFGGRRLAKWGSRGPGSSVVPLPLQGLLCPTFPHSQASLLQVAQAAASGVQGDVLREICEHIKGTSAETLRLCKELTETYCLHSASWLFTQSVAKIIHTLPSVFK